VFRFERVKMSAGGRSCVQCGREPVSTLTPASIEEAIASAYEAAKGDALGACIAFAGGEPLADPDLERYVTRARESGFQRIRVETHGGVALQPEAARRLVKAGVRSLCLVMLGADEDAHDGLCGEKGSYAALGSTAAAFLEAGSDIQIALSAEVPVCRHTVRSLPAIVTHAAELGASEVALDIGDPTFDLLQAAPWVAAACDTGTVNVVWVQVRGIPFCMLPAHGLHVSDVVEPRIGEKAPACADCALDPWCGGAVAGASPSVTRALRRPDDHEAFAEAISRVRGGDMS